MVLWIPLAIGALTAAAVYGDKRGGEKQNKMARRQAELSRKQARDVERAAEADANRLRMQGRRLNAEQRAAFAGHRVDITDTSGSVGDVQRSTRASIDADITRILVNAGREAWGLRQMANAQSDAGAAAREAGRDSAMGRIANTLIGVAAAPKPQGSSLQPDPPAAGTSSGGGYGSKYGGGSYWSSGTKR